MPKIVWKPLSKQALQACLHLKDTAEILFCPSNLSLLGDNSWSQESAQCHTVVWDTVENNQSLLKHLVHLDPQAFPKVRVADLGVVYYLSRRFPDLKIELDLTQGNHNLQGIESFSNRFPNLSRIVLGPEWPLNQIKDIRKDVPLEYPAYGPIVIFHSPRPLIQEGQNWSGYAQAEDKQHDLRVQQNEHGTFLIYPKKLNILDRLDQIDQAGIEFATICVEQPEEVELICSFLAGSSEAFNSLNQKFGPMSRAFSKSNRTDKQFKRLNVRRTQLKAPLGEVIEAKSKSHFIVSMNNFPPNSVNLISPEGKTIEADTQYWQEIGSSDSFPKFYKAAHKRWVCAGTKVWPIDPD